MYSNYIINEISDSSANQDFTDISYKDNYDGFCKSFAKNILSGTQGENKAYSFANIYIILSILCEFTAGASRKQIAEVLNHPKSEDIELIRKYAKAFYNDCNKETEMFRCDISDSLWINDGFDIEENALKNSGHYYTEIFKGNSRDINYTEALRQWLNRKTGNLLKDNIDGLEFGESTLAAIISTLYIACAWYEKFDKAQTYEQVFYGTKGESTLPFMHLSKGMNIFYSPDFTAVPRGISNGGNMWFILPAENISIDELVQRGDFAHFITNPNQWDNTEYTKVNFSVPQFDISCESDLIQSLKKSGICDIFSAEKADFSPLCKNGKLFIDKAEQASRVKIDEDGLEAASYTVMSIARTALLPDEEKTFCLNRPFIFAVTNANNAIMLSGIINHLQTT